jgi:hypothetical protein
MRAARCAYTSTMRKTPAAHGIHSQTPAAPAVPNRLGSRKKIAVVMLIIEPGSPTFYVAGQVR